jgi:hypothetical protein
MVTTFGQWTFPFISACPLNINKHGKGRFICIHRLQHLWKVHFHALER